jgi:SAM-dependent methyltransferase
MMPEHPLQALLREQIEYYRARASEYDEWFLRRGRYDLGPELNAQWFAEVAAVAAALDAFAPCGEVLELACGTGWWTEHLVRHAASITAVDASPEAIELNRARVRSPIVRYVQADIFTWQPDRQYDVVFFSFWLSHVPPVQFVPFWELVRRCLKPGGRTFFIDSLSSSTGPVREPWQAGPEAYTQRRRLNDGREFTIVKIYHRPAELAGRLRALGWDADVQATPNYFIYGYGSPRAGDG